MNHWFAKHGHSEKHKKYTQATQDINSGQKNCDSKVLPSGKRFHNYGKSPCYSWENPL